MRKHWLFSIVLLLSLSAEADSMNASIDASGQARAVYGLEGTQVHGLEVLP